MRITPSLQAAQYSESCLFFGDSFSHYSGGKHETKGFLLTLPAQRDIKDEEVTRGPEGL